MTEYDKFNREERAICSHVFRLLHESLNKEFDSPFGQVLKKIMGQNVKFYDISKVPKKLEFENIGIYTEVAIIRDYYKKLNREPYKFLDDLVTLIMEQENVASDCKKYSELSELGNGLNKPWETHPKQILLKATENKLPLTLNEKRVYGALQGMFNAKPDLVLTIDNKLIVIEAKFTEKFDQKQLDRTLKIAQVWSKLLFLEFGFRSNPEYAIVKLGPSKYDPDITWEDISNIADMTYPPDDKTRIAFNLGLKLLQNPKTLK
jgi:hypothetical protein